MDNMKRFVSMLLCVVMMLGFLPVSAVAADASETPLDAALFFSDLHTTASSYKESDIKAVMGGVKTSGLDFSTVTSVGDAFSSNDYVNKGRTTAAITEAIRTGLGDADVPVYYAWSDHDRGTDVKNFTGLMHSGENYYIYAISMSDMSSAERYGQPSTFTEDKLTAFTKTVEGLDHTKPLFIVSHLPLHDRRNDNQYANEWYEVISAAAEQMDVVFLWGHNHTSETSVDTAAYYVAKDGSEKRTCGVCGEEEFADIPATGHSHALVEFCAPTCELNGYEFYRCEGCGNEYQIILEKTGHDYQDGICGNCGEKDPDACKPGFSWGSLIGKWFDRWFGDHHQQKPTEPPTEPPKPTDPPATEAPKPTDPPATNPPATDPPKPTDPPATNPPAPPAEGEGSGE